MHASHAARFEMLSACPSSAGGPVACVWKMGCGVELLNTENVPHTAKVQLNLPIHIRQIQLRKALCVANQRSWFN